MSRVYSLIFFLVLVVGGGLVIGYLTAPGAWYAGLTKPSFNPPGWVFGPVWTLLYIAIAVAGWRIWHRDPSGRGKALWSAQLVLNFAWSPAFFAAHRIDLALGIIVLLLAAILSFIWVARRLDPLASWLFAPYAAWVGFATVLNASLLALN